MNSILFAGGGWSQRQLHAGICYISVGLKLRISLTSVKHDSSSYLPELYSSADYSTTAGRIPIRFARGCWARRQLRNRIGDVIVA